MAAEASAGAGVSLRRGKLDADLVVDIVLDRARQAAIKLVVDELIGAERKARYRYLADLLDQGAALLADPSTLRREKFQDLGMTVVRAFVASNLVDGLRPGAEELIAAPIVGPSLAGLGVVAGTPVPAVVHGYLVDVAYRWLGETRLFGRTESNARADAPGKATQGLCPWPDGAGAALCTSLADRATVEKIPPRRPRARRDPGGEGAARGGVRRAAPADRSGVAVAHDCRPRQDAGPQPVGVEVGAGRRDPGSGRPAARPAGRSPAP